MRGKILLLMLLLLAIPVFADDSVLRTLSEEEISEFYATQPDNIEPSLIKIKPITPFDPILASIPEPVFDMNDIEPKPKVDLEVGETPVEKIMRLVEAYYSNELPKKNQTENNNPNQLELPLERDGKRYGLRIPSQHEKIVMSPGSGRIVYGDFKMESNEENGAVPPILIRKGKKKLSQIWVYLHNNSLLRVEDQDFRFYTDKRIEIIDQDLYLDGFQMRVMPAELHPLNYNNIEYELFLDVSEEGLKYIIEYNGSNGVLILDANDDLEYDITENSFTAEGIEIKGNRRLDLGGQGFIVALTDNQSYLVTKDTMNNPIPVNAKMKIRNGRLDIAGKLISVAPESIYEKYGMKDITLIEKDDESWYYFKSQKFVKILFFFEKKIKINNYISATDVNKVVEEFPWWNFLVTSK